MRFFGLVISILVVLSVGGIFFYHHLSSSSQYSTARVTQGNIIQEVSASGKISSEYSADLSFNRNGTIATEPLAVGSVVQQGEILAKLDTATLQTQLTAAKASVSLARAQSSTTVISADSVKQTQDTLVANAYQNLLSSGLVARAQNTTSLTAPVITGPYTGPEGTYKIIISTDLSQTGDSSFTLQTFGIEQTSPVVISKTNPTKLGTYGLSIAFPDDVRKYADTIWYVDIPNMKSAVYGTNLSAYNAAKATRDQAITVAETNSAQVQGVSASAAQLQNAQANLANIETQIGQSSIVAPFTGTVVTQNAKKGASALAGVPLMTLSTSNMLNVELNVSENNIVDVQVGDHVRMTLDATGDHQYTGTVVRIDPASITIGGATYYKATVAFAEPDQRFREGMTVNAYIQTAAADNALMVPASAITDLDNTPVVYTLENNKPVAKKVKLGLTNQSGMVEIVSGLTNNEVVITGQRP